MSAQITITQLPTAGALTGQELVPIVQNGVTVQTTTGAISTGSSGSVTSVAVSSANGFSGSVADPTGAANITLSTTVTGMLKGSGTGLATATANTDYQSPIALTTTGSSGAATFDGSTLNIPQYSGGGGGSGTVTSVAASVPGFLSVTGSPITTSGTLAISYSGTALPIAYGGTALTTTPTNGQLLIGNGTGYSLSTLTAGSNITITNTAGGISIASTAAGTGTVTSVGQSFTGGLISVSGSPVTTSGTLALTVAGTSGGVPYFSSASTWASSAALTQYGVLYGGGAGSSPASTAAGTTGQVLTATTGAAPTWANPATNGTVTSVGQSFTGGLISVSGSPVTSSGTLALTVAGTSGGIPYFSSASTWATSAALASNAIVIGGGAGAAPATTTTGTGVLTAIGNTTNAANGIVVKDTNSNISANNFLNGFASVVSAGTTTTLTVSSAPYQLVTGSTSQTFQLPNATTLANGTSFAINNNSSAGTVTINNGAASPTQVTTVGSGGYVTITLLDNSTQAGSWDFHFETPSNTTWSTNTLSTGSAVTSSQTVQGTRLISTVTTGTAPLTVASTTQVANLNAATAGTAGNVTGTVAVANGGTGLTAGTSGGIPYFSSTSAMTSSALLTQYGIVYGGGSAASPVATAAGTTGQTLIATTSAAPTWGTLGVAGGGTGLTSGTSGGIPYYSSTSAITSSSLLASNALMVGGGAGTAPSTITTGTGVVTALGVNTGSSGAFATQGGAIISATTINDSAGTGYAIGYRQMPQNSQTGATYTLVLADDGKHIYLNTGSTNTITVPTNASVAFAIGTVITVVNGNSGTCTITGPTSGLQLANGAAATSRSLATKGMATMIKVAADLWYVSGAGVT